MYTTILRPCNKKFDISKFNCSTTSIIQSVFKGPERGCFIGVYCFSLCPVDLFTISMITSCKSIQLSWLDMYWHQQPLVFKDLEK